MYKYLLSVLLLLSPIVKCSDMEIISTEDTELFRIKFYAKEELQKLGLYFDKKGYHVQTESDVIDIPTYNIEPMLREVSKYQLEKFLEAGYVTLIQVDDNEFVIKGNVRGLGGGPITGAVLSWVTRAVGYGAPIAVGGAAVVAIGGPGLVAGGGAKVIIGGVASKVVGGGAGMAAGLIAQSGTAMTIAAESSTALAAMGSYVSTVETASAAAFGLGCAIPFLP